MNLGLQLLKIIGLHCTRHPPHLPTQLPGLRFMQVIDAFLNFKLRWKDHLYKETKFSCNKHWTYK